jgi:N-acylneuraminate cytidylyltransferase
MNILGLITARSGSKGLPGKNIRPLNGHPLIAYSILASLKSNTINRTIVSTDDKLIKDIATDYGAEVPVFRPKKFATDNSTDLEAFCHMLTWLKSNENYVPDFVVHLRPTSPLRTLSHIDEAITKLVKSNYDSLRIVTDAPVTPFKMWKINEKGNRMFPILKDKNISEPYNAARQSLPKIYWQIGYLDVIRTSTIVKKNSMSGKKILPYYVDPMYISDIDDLSDFENTEIKISNILCIKF